jgi:hypothetical protein
MILEPIVNTAKLSTAMLLTVKPMGTIGAMALRMSSDEVIPS